jgi:hypothetical protein
MVAAVWVSRKFPRENYRTREICTSCVRVWSDSKILAAATVQAIEVQLVKYETLSTRGDWHKPIDGIDLLSSRGILSMYAAPNLNAGDPEA